MRSISLQRSMSSTRLDSGHFLCLSVPSSIQYTGSEILVTIVCKKILSSIHIWSEFQLKNQLRANLDGGHIMSLGRSKTRQSHFF